MGGRIGSSVTPSRSRAWNLPGFAEGFVEITNDNACVVSPLRGSPHDWALRPGYRAADGIGRIIHPGSASESRLLSFLRDTGVRGARSQIEIFDGDGFVARPDVVFEDVKLAIEVDSWTWHTDKTRRRADARRQNHLERMGWTVLRFFREDIYFDPDYVVAEIRATLLEIRSRGTI